MNKSVTAVDTILYLQLSTRRVSGAQHHAQLTRAVMEELQKSIQQRGMELEDSNSSSPEPSPVTIIMSIALLCLVPNWSAGRTT